VHEDLRYCIVKCEKNISYNERSSPLWKVLGVTDANRDTIVDDPRRPLRSTSHLDSRAGPTGSSFSYLDSAVVSLPYSSCLTSRFEMEGKERTFSLSTRDYRQHRGIPRNNTQKSLFPDRSYVPRPFSALRQSSWSSFTNEFTAYVRLQTRIEIHLYTSLLVEQRFHPRGYPLFPTVFSARWYIASIKDIVRSRFPSWCCFYTGEHVLSYDKSSRNVKPPHL